MSRTQIVLDSKNNEQSSMIIEEILDSHKFDPVSKNGEDYWQQGIGVSQAPKYIKYYFDGDKVILEGWISNFGKESDLKGVVGALPKKSCRKVLDEISEAIEKSNTEQKNDSPKTVENKETTTKKAVENKETTTKKAVENKETTTKKEDNNQTPKSDETGGNTNKNSNKSASNQKSSKGIIPRRYRGSILTNILEIIIAIFYIIGASSGYLVLRFTDSSEALIFVAIIILIHGFLALISNLQDT